MLLFKFVVMVICLRAKTNFFNNNFCCLSLYYFISFLLFVKKLFIIHNLANRRIGIWRNFNKIQSLLICYSQSISSRVDSHFNVLSNQTYVGSSDFGVNLVFFLLCRPSAGLTFSFNCYGFYILS